MFPRGSVFDAIDRSSVKAEAASNCGASGSKCQPAADFLNNFVRQNRSKVLFTGRSVPGPLLKAEAQDDARVLNILGASGPFQVVWMVVVFVSVFVVNLGLAFGVGMKGKGDHAVKLVGSFSVAKKSGRAPVASFVGGTFNNAFRASQSPKAAGFQTVGSGNTFPNLHLVFSNAEYGKYRSIK